MTYDNFEKLTLETDEQARTRIDAAKTQGEGEGAAVEAGGKIPDGDSTFEAETLANVAAASDVVPDNNTEKEIARINANLGIKTQPEILTEKTESEMDRVSREIDALMEERDQLEKTRNVGVALGPQLDAMGERIKELLDRQRGIVMDIIAARQSSPSVESGSSSTLDTLEKLEDGGDGKKNVVETKSHPVLNQAELYADWFAHTSSTRDLLGGLRNFGDIIATDGNVHKISELIPLIASLTGPDDPNIQKVTRTYGLRAKVVETLSKNK